MPGLRRSACRGLFGLLPASLPAGHGGRATQLHDFGENAPETWEDAYRNDTCHIALTIYAADKPALDVAVEKAMAEFDASTGVTLVGTHEFGADEDAENPFGFRDSISQPTVAGAGVDPQPGQERAIAAGEFVLGENSETGEPISMPSPDPLGRNGSFVVLRKYDSRVGAFNEFLRAQTGTQRRSMPWPPRCSAAGVRARRCHYHRPGTIRTLARTGSATTISISRVT